MAKTGLRDIIIPLVHIYIPTLVSLLLNSFTSLVIVVVSASMIISGCQIQFYSFYVSPSPLYPHWFLRWGPTFEPIFVHHVIYNTLISDLMRLKSV